MTSGLTRAFWSAARSGSVPSRILRTGTSSFFPDSVRGMPGTWWISSGTWRGESWDRRAPPGGHHVKDQPPLGAEPAGVHHQAVGDLTEALDHAVELTGPHPDPAAV